MRLATLSFFRNLPPDAWMRSGIASDNRFTVRALAYLVAGHAEYHVQILRERYSIGCYWISRFNAARASSICGNFAA